MSDEKPPRSYGPWEQTQGPTGVRVYARDDLIRHSGAELSDQLKRMAKGSAPMGPDGKSVNVHHVGQRCHLDGGKVVMITETMHKQYHSVLHMPERPSTINRSAFNAFRRKLWKDYANRMESALKKQEHCNKLEKDYRTSAGLDSLQRFDSFPKPGGVMLVKQVAVANIEYVHSARLIRAERGPAVVMTLQDGLPCKEWTLQLQHCSWELLKDVAHSVYDTDLHGVMISMEMGPGQTEILTQGDLTPHLQQALEEADVTLGAWAFGVHPKDGRKYEPQHVSSYLNPLDAKRERLRQSAPEALKFHSVDLHPTLEINPRHSLEAGKDGKLAYVHGGNVLRITARGRYVDWFGTHYYDDSATHCAAYSHLLESFKSRFEEYRKEPGIALCEELATLTGVFNSLRARGVRVAEPASVRREGLVKETRQSGVDLHCYDEEVHKLHYALAAKEEDSVLKASMFRQLACLSTAPSRTVILALACLSALGEGSPEAIDEPLGLRTSAYTIVARSFFEAGDELVKDTNVVKTFCSVFALDAMPAPLGVAQLLAGEAAKYAHDEQDSMHLACLHGLFAAMGKKELAMPATSPAHGSSGWDFFNQACAAIVPKLQPVQLKTLQTLTSSATTRDVQALLEVVESIETSDVDGQLGFLAGVSAQHAVELRKDLDHKNFMVNHYWLLSYAKSCLCLASNSSVRRAIPEVDEQLCKHYFLQASSDALSAGKALLDDTQAPNHQRLHDAKAKFEHAMNIAKSCGWTSGEVKAHTGIACAAEKIANVYKSAAGSSKSDWSGMWQAVAGLERSYAREPEKAGAVASTRVHQQSSARPVPVVQQQCCCIVQ